MQNIQFKKDQKDTTLEIRFRNSNNYSRSGYFCRHIPLILIEGLKQWWKKTDKTEDSYCKRQMTNANFYMYPNRDIQIEQIDSLGRKKTNSSWHLPKKVIEELIKYDLGGQYVR